MRRTDELKRLLEDLTAVYNDNEKIDVKYGKVPKMLTKSTVMVAPNITESMGKSTLSGADELRVIVDQLSHEIEHTRESSPEGKRRFAESYPNQRNLAGAVRNVVEDAYIDASRTNRFRGLRRGRAFVADSVMSNRYRRPKMSALPPQEAMLEGLVQIGAAGYAKDIANADPEVQQFLAWARHRLEKARATADEDDREQLSREIMEQLWAHGDGDVDGLQEADDAADEGFQGATDDPEEIDDWEVEERAAEQGMTPEEMAESAEDALSDAEPAALSPDQFDEMLEEMERADAEKESRAWFNVDGDDDYSEADDEWEERFKKLKQDIAESESELGRRKEQREASMVDNRADKALDTLKHRGLADEIEEAFREIKTRDRDVAVRSGPRIDIRNAVRHMAGDYTEDRLYSRRKQAEVGDRAIGVAVDASGSMDMHEARVALAALASAAGEIGDKLTVSAFMTTHRQGGIELPLVTAPDEEWDDEHLNALWSGHLTPTASGLMDAYQLVKQISRPERVVICITDGIPNVARSGSTDGGEDVDGAGLVDAKRAVQEIRGDGVKVIGFGVGRHLDHDMLEAVYGSNGYVVADDDKLAERLVEVYRSLLRTA